MAGDEHLAVAREALQAGLWGEARARFEAALREGETPEALTGLAEAAGWLGDVATATAAGERAFLLLRERGDDESAARVASMLAFAAMNMRGDAAVASGWLGRARSLLRSHPDSPALVMVAGLQGALAAGWEKDFARARPLLEEALTRARSMGDLDTEMIGTGQFGLMLVRSGEVTEGMRLLDEAAAAAVAGELRDLGNAVRVTCFLVTACLDVRDFDRAAQWSRYALEMSGGDVASPLFDYPRTEHAAVQVWWGRWPEAERELGELMEDAVARPVPAALAHLRLADLRRRQGRFDEAQSLLDELDAAPHRRGLGELTVVARAALELDRNVPDRAAELAERYLRAVPAEDVVERVDALEILARARAAVGDNEGAAMVVAELEDVARRLGTRPVLAAARYAAGVVAGARGDRAAALDDLEEAVRQFDAAETPFEAARVRLQLARTLLDLGRQESAAKEARIAKLAFDALGARAAADRAARLLVEIEPAARGRPDLRLTAREVDVIRLVGQGRSNEEIAADLVLSVRTVERHVANVYAKIGAHGRAARAMATAFAHRNGLA